MKPKSGTRILTAVAKLENRCERRTEEAVPKMGKKAPLCYEYVGHLITYAELIGTCHYGCPGKSEEAHAIWYLAARGSSFGRAALRLARMGFYDEALIVVRSLGEIANLFCLFDLAPESMEEWRTSDRQYRLDKLSPSKIRKRIDALGLTPLITAERYAALCEISTHPVPDLRPQKFNHTGRSLVGGGLFQEAGFLVVLNELALALLTLVILGARVCKVPKKDFLEIKQTCLNCARHLGGVDVLSVKDSLDRIAALRSS
jgi:hypothetical protein